MPLDFTREERVSRMDRLIALEKDCSEQANLRYVGKTVRVLVESESREGGYLGRTATGKLVLFSYDGNSPVGKFLNCRIDRATPHGLFGTLDNQK